MPYFRTTRRFAPGGRLGHDRIALAVESLGALPYRPLRTYYLYIIMLCSYYKNQVNAGITYIPSADV